MARTRVMRIPLSLVPTVEEMIAKSTQATIAQETDEAARVKAMMRGFSVLVKKVNADIVEVDDVTSPMNHYQRYKNWKDMVWVQLRVGSNVEKVHAHICGDQIFVKRSDVNRVRGK